MSITLSAWHFWLARQGKTEKLVDKYEKVPHSSTLSSNGLVPEEMPQKQPAQKMRRKLHIKETNSSQQKSKLESVSSEQHCNNPKHKDVETLAESENSAPEHESSKLGYRNEMVEKDLGVNAGLPEAYEDGSNSTTTQQTVPKIQFVKPKDPKEWDKIEAELSDDEEDAAPAEIDGDNSPYLFP